MCVFKDQGSGLQNSGEQMVIFFDGDSRVTRTTLYWERRWVRRGLLVQNVLSAQKGKAFGTIKKVSISICYLQFFFVAFRSYFLIIIVIISLIYSRFDFVSYRPIQ